MVITLEKRNSLIKNVRKWNKIALGLEYMRGVASPLIYSNTKAILFYILLFSIETIHFF
jgi:hypothetical protein